MEQPIHSISSLFAQLGLDSSDEAIASFVANNAPIPSEVALSEAIIWNASQAALLKQKIDDDADWAEVVDQLNTMLR